MNQAKSNQLWVMIALVVTILMINIDFTVVNLALVSIAEDLHIDLDSVQWLLSGYVLAWSALVVPSGKLGDILGMRRIFLYGVILFSVASLFAGVANSEWLIVTSRVVQGVGGAMIIPGAYGLIATAFPPEKQGTAMGMLCSGSAVGLALGPTLGGFIIHALSWRWIFYINIPLGVFVVWVCYKKLSKEIDDLASKSKFDCFGSCILAISLVGLMYSLSQVQAWGATSPLFLSTLIGSIALFLIFMFMQFGKESPLVDFKMFTNKGFISCVLLCTALEWCFVVGLFVMGFYLQNIKGFSVLKSGVILLAMTIIYGALSPMGGRMMDTVGARKPVIIGLVFTIAAGVLWTFLNAESSLWFIILALFTYGIGIGFAFPPLFTLIMKVVKEDEIGMATSLNMMSVLLALTLSMILTSLIWVACSQYKIVQLFKEQGVHLAAATRTKLEFIVSQAHIEKSDYVSLHLASVQQMMVNLHSAFSYALSFTMTINIVISLAGLAIAVFLMPKGKL